MRILLFVFNYLYKGGICRFHYGVMGFIPRGRMHLRRPPFISRRWRAGYRSSTRIWTTILMVHHIHVRANTSSWATAINQICQMSWPFNILLRWVIIVPRVFWYSHCHFATFTRKQWAEWFRILRSTWIVSNIAIRIMFHSYFHNELYSNFNVEHLPLHKHDKPQIKQSHLSLVCYHNHIQSRLN